MRPQRARMMVVLPEPLGPRKPKSSPQSRWKLTSSTAVTSPKRMVRCSALITTREATTALGARGASRRGHYAWGREALRAVMEVCRRSLEGYRGGHAGLEDVVGVVDVDFDAEDFVLAVVAGLDVAGEELGGGVDLLDVAGEVAAAGAGVAEGIDCDVGGLAYADAAEVGFGGRRP